MAPNSPVAICLVRPPAVESFRFATTSVALPLGLAYIAAALKAARFDVQVIDAVGEGPESRTRYCQGYLIGLSLEQIVARISANADIIGITVVFTHEWPAVVKLIALIRRRLPDAAIVIGGEHATSMPEFSLLTSSADVAVLGEGEETIVELVRALRRGQALELIPGIAFRRPDGVHTSRRRDRQTKIDEISVPDWGSFSPVTYHRHRFVGGMYSSRMTMPILATRGCPYQCTYCSAPNMWTPRWIPRDPIAVVNEIESYVHRYGAGNFPFQDLTAIIQKSWIKAFCEELIRRKLDITWQLPTGTRSEAIDAEVAQLLKASGMTSMAYAPESGSEGTRRLIKKKMTNSKLFESVDAAATAGLNVAVFLVIGFPHDRPESIAENYPFIDELGRRGVSDVSVGFYMALPGTELFHSLYDAGRIRIDRAYFRHILTSLALVPSQSYCDALSPAALVLWKLRLYRRFYGAKKRDSRDGFVRSAMRALRGLVGDGSHATKLESAFRNALTSGMDTVKVLAGRRYMSRAEEAAMFGTWDAVFRSVREQKVANAVVSSSPADTTVLHRSNVIAALIKEHRTPHVILHDAGVEGRHW